jgi:hypothetical protein
MNPGDYNSAQDKEYSRLSTIVSKSREKVNSEKEIISQKPLTYVQKRAHKSLEFHKNQLLNLEAEFERRKQEHLTFIKHAEAELESKNPSIIKAEIALKMAIEKRDRWMKSQIPQSYSISVPQVKEKVKEKLEEDVPIIPEDVFMFEGKRVSEFEYKMFTRQASVTPEPPQETTETDLEEPESEIDDYQLARDIEEAKQRQRHFLLHLPKKPIKMVNCLPLQLSL